MEKKNKTLNERTMKTYQHLKKKEKREIKKKGKYKELECRYRIKKKK